MEQCGRASRSRSAAMSQTHCAPSSRSAFRSESAFSTPTSAQPSRNTLTACAPVVELYPLGAGPFAVDAAKIKQTRIIKVTR